MTEVILTPFQVEVFDLTIQRFATVGVGSASVFADTYVLQKAVAEYISANTITSGNSSTIAVQVYNGILGIIPVVTSNVTPKPKATANSFAAPTTPVQRTSPVVSQPAPVLAKPAAAFNVGPATRRQ